MQRPNFDSLDGHFDFGAVFSDIFEHAKTGVSGEEQSCSILLAAVRY